ncbi:MAG: hypothetical protein ABR568_00670 [Pyrinomonadaceae bacterium]
MIRQEIASAMLDSILPAEVIHAGLAEWLKPLPRAFSKHVWAAGSYGAYSKYVSVFTGTEPRKAREKLAKRMIGTALPTEHKNKAEARAAEIMNDLMRITFFDCSRRSIRVQIYSAIS